MRLKSPWRDPQDEKEIGRCAKCDGELYGERDMAHYNGKDYCLNCYERLLEEEDNL